jgi:hypothetical protein
MFAMLASPEAVPEINLLLPFLLYHFSMLATLIRVVTSLLTAIIRINTNFIFFRLITALESPASMNMGLDLFDRIHYHIRGIMNNSTLPFLA